MEKTFKRGEHSGFTIGKDIEIHGHISDPEAWFLTIRPLEIFGRSFCHKPSTEDDIISKVKAIIKAKIRVAESILIQVGNGRQ